MKWVNWWSGKWMGFFSLSTHQLSNGNESIDWSWLKERAALAAGRHQSLIVFFNGPPASSLQSNSIFSFHSTNQRKKCYFFALVVDEEKMNWLVALLFLQQMKDFQFVEWNELRGKKRNETNSINSIHLREWNGMVSLFFL